MAFREVLESGAEEFFRNEEFDQFGIDLIENVPKEITGLALEMEDRLSGT